MSSNVHSIGYQPRAIPAKGLTTSGEIDRVQEIGDSSTLNRTKINELGTAGIIDYQKQLFFLP